MLYSWHAAPRSCSALSISRVYARYSRSQPCLAQRILHLQPRCMSSLTHSCNAENVLPKKPFAVQPSWNNLTNEEVPNTSTFQNKPTSSQHGSQEEEDDPDWDLRGGSSTNTYNGAESTWPSAQYFSRSWYHLYKTIITHTTKLKAKDTDTDLPLEELLTVSRRMSRGFIGSRKTDDIRNWWERRSSKAQHDILPYLLVGALWDSAKLSLHLLEVLPKLPRDFQIRMQCLFYIEQTYGDEIKGNEELSEQYHAQIHLQSDPKIWPSTVVPTHLDLLIRYLPFEQGEATVHTYLEKHPSLPWRTSLYFVDHFTRRNRVDDALEMLARLPSEFLAASGPRVLQRCANLLLLDTVDESEHAKNFKILPKVLMLGIRPNAILHNIVMRNAMKAGLPNVAWDLYCYMRSEGLEVNVGGHIAILRDAFLRQDVPRLNEIMTVIHQQEDLIRDPDINAYMMNIVRVVCFSERRTTPDEAFSRLLALYDRAFDREPLSRLRLVNPRVHQNVNVSQPGPVSLGFTLWSYVLVHREERPVDALWERLTKFVLRGDPHILEAAKHDVFYNGFILFYTRSSSTIAKALNVLRYMLEQDLCMPTARTWSLLMCGFLRHGQEGAADQVRQMMLSCGMRPADGDWDFLFSHYPQSMVGAQIRSTLDEDRMPVGPAVAMDAEDAKVAEAEEPLASTHMGTVTGTASQWQGLLDWGAHATAQIEASVERNPAEVI